MCCLIHTNFLLTLHVTGKMAEQLRTLLSAGTQMLKNSHNGNINHCNVWKELFCKQFEEKPIQKREKRKETRGPSIEWGHKLTMNINWGRRRAKTGIFRLKGRRCNNWGNKIALKGSVSKESIDHTRRKRYKQIN